METNILRIQKIGLTAIIILCLSIVVKSQSLTAPFKKSKFQSLTSNSELLPFLNEAQQNNKLITYKHLCKRSTELIVPLVVISNGNYDEKKIRILLIGLQCGDEHAGKEGLIMLIENFANNNNDDILNKSDIYIIPQLNPEGNEQNQPENNFGINLKTDYIALLYLEPKTKLNLFNELFNCNLSASSLSEKHSKNNQYYKL